MGKEEIDYKLAAHQLRTGKPLFGEGGALAPMLERILNAALEGEMDAHLDKVSREAGNRRNGRMSKKVQTQYGEVTVETPRDRDGSFEPETVRKRETILAEGMADQIIGMYAFGTSTREISRYFESVQYQTFGGDYKCDNRQSIARDKGLEEPFVRSCLFHLLDGCYTLQSEG